MSTLNFHFIKVHIIKDNNPNAFVVPNNKLIVSSGLIEQSPDYVSLLAVLAHEVGHLQYFHGNQALGHHAWVKLIERQVVRAYAWVGETAWNQGPITIAEKRSGMRAFDYFEEDSDSYINWETVRRNVEQLPLLASIWSIDPVVLLDVSIRVKPGWIGRLSVKRTKKN